MSMTEPLLDTPIAHPLESTVTIAPDLSNPLTPFNSTPGALHADPVDRCPEARPFEPSDVLSPRNTSLLNAKSLSTESMPFSTAASVSGVSKQDVPPVYDSLTGQSTETVQVGIDASLSSPWPTDSPSLQSFSVNALDLDDLNSMRRSQTSSLTTVASLVWSANPNLTAREVHTVLAQTAYDLGRAGYDLVYGHGFVNADAAVRRAIALR